MIYTITIIGFMSGILGTVIGAIISLFFRKRVDVFLNFFMGISGGIMLAIVAFDLIPEAMTQVGMVKTIIFTLLGAFISFMIKKYVNFDSKLRIGYLIFISILIHNLPEGLAIGSSFISKESLGMTLALVISIHNVPEGLAMALSLINGKMNSKKVILYAILAGIPMGVGAYLGAYLGDMFNTLIGCFLALAAGTMLYITIEEIFPNSKSIYSIFGVVIGIFVVNIFS